MYETCTLWLANAEKTRSAGASLARSLYTRPLTITLEGTLGSGKTTFLQGFIAALGVREPVTSPTFALEQRYVTREWGTFLHLDLYRLSPAEAAELLSQSANHEDIRAIEWPKEPRSEEFLGDASIHMELTTEGAGRCCCLLFHDLPLPSTEEIARWRQHVLLPNHIIRHCDAVGALARRMAEALLTRGTIARPLALLRAGQVHDLLRFVDFSDGASPPGTAASTEERERWEELRAGCHGMRHEEAAASFLRDRGYPHLAEIVAVHGLQLPTPERRTTEQKILYYADKRVTLDQVVTLEERFSDFQNRYGRGKESEEGKMWYEEAKGIEEELFPEGTPC